MYYVIIYMSSGNTTNKEGDMEHVVSFEGAMAWAKITKGMTAEQVSFLKDAFVKAAEIAAHETARILSEQGK